MRDGEVIEHEGNEVYESSVPQASGDNALIQMALSGQADITIIEKLVDLQNQQEDRRAEKLFNQAMAKFQGEIPTIQKEGVVDFTSPKGRTYYTHARLEDIAKSIRPFLTKNGLSYRFTQTIAGQQITVGCIISHSGGHFEKTEFTGPVDTSGGKDVLKGSASTVSYLRRYTLTGALGIVVGGEDDEALQEEVKPEELDSKLFDEKFPTWSRSIEGGKKTSKEVISYIEEKGVNLSEDQKTKLNSVKVNK